MKSIFVMGLILFSALGYIAAQSIAPGYTLVKSDIKFSHQFHVEEQEMECADCHPTLSASNQASQNNKPTMDECADCHDIEDDELCGDCHLVGDEPAETIDPLRELAFNHQKHLAFDLECQLCHKNIYESEENSKNNYPVKPICMDCHNGQKAFNDCAKCHTGGTTLLDIHPAGWQNSHADRAVVEQEWCAKCHTNQNLCLDCHRGNNLTGSIHDLNYYFTHGLEAENENKDCRHCHNTKRFCADCHNQQLRMPLNHSRVDWGIKHGEAARTDVENCAACHDNNDLTCARAGCHSDYDGIIGTDPSIHNDNAQAFNYKGEWHNGGGYYCYQCHLSTPVSVTGFCNYCHETKSD